MSTELTALSAGGLLKPKRSIDLREVLDRISLEAVAFQRCFVHEFLDDGVEDELKRRGFVVDHSTHCEQVIRWGDEASDADSGSSS